MRFYFSESLARVPGTRWVREWVWAVAVELSRGIGRSTQRWMSRQAAGYSALILN